VNIFIARDLSKDDLEFDGLCELASNVVATEAVDSDEKCVPLGREDDWLRMGGVCPCWGKDIREGEFGLGCERDLLRRGFGIFDRFSTFS
jgi:hypothetical protein